MTLSEELSPTHLDGVGCGECTQMIPLRTARSYRIVKDNLNIFFATHLVLQAQLHTSGFSLITLYEVLHQQSLHKRMSAEKLQELVCRNLGIIIGTALCGATTHTRPVKIWHRGATELYVRNSLDWCCYKQYSAPSARMKSSPI